MIGGDANARLNGARAMMKTKLDATRHSRALLFFFASISAEDELDELENSADVRLFLVVCANRTNPVRPHTPSFSSRCDFSLAISREAERREFINL